MRIQHNKIAFTQLKIRKYDLKPLKPAKEKPINAIDTETLFGYAKLICDNSRHYTLVSNVNEVLKALTNKRFRYSHNFFYNIRFDFQALFKYLPDSNLRELYSTTKTAFEGYKLKYIPKKLFRIMHSHNSYVYYDLFNFYETSLQEAASKYLQKPKNIEDIDRARLNYDAQYWQDNLADIISYCINDAQLTAELGTFLQNEFKNKIGFLPRKYISKASVTKQYFRRLCDIPSIRKIPPPVLSYAFNSYHGGRFEVLQKGYFPSVTLIDLHSAYPYHTANLVDISQASYSKVSNMDADATYGFYLCRVSVPYQYCAPLAYSTNYNKIIFPVGDFSTFLTKEEVLAYEPYCEIKVIKGYEISVPNKTYPFKEAMRNLYTWKQNTPKDDFRYELVKKIMNALPGCFYEKNRNNGFYLTGQLFNPIYASIILANTRIQAFLEAMKHPKDTLAFATDSVLIRGLHDIEDNHQMGTWGVDNSGTGVVLRSGIYQIADEIKTRGMQKRTKLKTPYGNFKNIFDYIHAKPELTRYKLIISRPVNLAEAILHHKKFSLSDINVWQDFPYVININRDAKRGYYDYFEKGGDLFEYNISSDPIFLTDRDQQHTPGYIQHKIDIHEHRRAREQQFNEIGLEIDQQVKNMYGRDSEILNEMKNTLRQDRYYMEKEQR